MKRRTQIPHNFIDIIEEFEARKQCVVLTIVFWESSRIEQSTKRRQDIHRLYLVKNTSQRLFSSL